MWTFCFAQNFKIYKTVMNINQQSTPNYILATMVLNPKETSYVENLYDFSRNLKVLDLFTMWICQQKKLEEYEIVDTLNFRVSFRHDFYIQKSKFPVFKIYQNFPNSLNKYDDKFTKYQNHCKNYNSKCYFN